MSTPPNKSHSGNSGNHNSNTNRERPPAKPAPTRLGHEPPTLHTIVCSMCGKEDQVPFKPTRGTAVLCRDCFEVKKRRKHRNREIMRKVAGRFKVICENCGTEVELNYRRATEPVKLCDECYVKLKGKVPDRTRNKRLQVTISIVCCRCGKREYVNFVPEDPDKVLCRSCYMREQKNPENEGP
jgi:CxxC-x17-CxxC domain-containing protein